MEPIRFTVPGRPMPAPRMTQKSKYQHGPYFDYKELVGWYANTARVQMMKRPEINITVYLSSGVHGDWDNYGKTVCDSLKNIAWKDDKQVMFGSVRKVLGVPEKEQRLEVELCESS